MQRLVGIRGHRGAGKDSVAFLLASSLEFLYHHQNQVNEAQLNQLYHQLYIGTVKDLVEDKDISDEMMKKIYFLKSDMFSSFDKLRDELGIASFDIITANPPYIRRDELTKLQDEVSKYEPRLALDGDKDGLKYYREIAKSAHTFLNPGGKIYLEIGYDQADDVKKIFETSGYTHIETVKDLGGNDRVIIFI